MSRIIRVHYEVLYNHLSNIDKRLNNSVLLEGYRVVHVRQSDGPSFPESDPGTNVFPDGTRISYYRFTTGVGNKTLLRQNLFPIRVEGTEKPFIVIKCEVTLSLLYPSSTNHP